MVKAMRGGQRKGRSQGWSDLREMIRDGQKWSKAREVVRERSKGRTCQKQLDIRTAG